MLLSWIYSSDNVSQHGSTNSALTVEDLDSPLQSNCKAGITCPRKILPQKEFPSSVQKPKHVPFLAMLVTRQTLSFWVSPPELLYTGKTMEVFSIHSADLSTTGTLSPEELLDDLATCFCCSSSSIPVEQKE